MNLSTGTAILILGLAGATVAAAQEPAQEEQQLQQQARQRPCATPEYRQFDFWAGRWEVRTPDGKLAGTNTIRSILNGCALEESWQGAGGSIGKSFNMYYARDGRWHQSWVDGGGTRLDLAGGLDERGRMVLSGTMPGPTGEPVRHEISWERLEDGAVKQHWRASKEGSEEWQDVFVGIYRPAVEEPPQDMDRAEG